MLNSHLKHDYKDELKALSLRATPARIAIMTYLESVEKPIDVQSMIKYLSKNDIKTDPATVFRIVNMFREKGLLSLVQFQEGKFRYELSSKADHHHFICESCESISDISDCNINNMQKEIQKKKGFLVKRHSLEFYGLCANCQE